MPAPARTANVRLPRAFYLQRTLALARALIGMRLVHLDAGVRRVGRIVETEAYQGPRDLAAHSARGRTPRTEVMFGPPGHAYVYLVYGMWNCLNVVAGAAGTPHAVLLRALEPLDGLDARTAGPGLLTRAMRIDRRLNGVDLCGELLWIEAPAEAPQSARRRRDRPRIVRTPRIGVDYAGAWAARRWRFYDRDSPWVSTLSAAARARLAAAADTRA